MAVFGACQCSAAASGPCACARAAAQMMQDVAHLNDKVCCLRHLAVTRIQLVSGLQTVLWRPRYILNTDECTRL